MCLLIGNKEGHILKKDFVCFKRLNKKGTKYLTPFQDWEVELDTLLFPDKKAPRISNFGYKYQVNGGAIHAYTNAQDQYSDEKIILVKAIIPAGTRFWLQDNLTEVAAEKLQLTSEIVKPGNAISDLSELFEEGADVILRDGTRHKLIAGDYDKSKVKGIHAYDNMVISTEIFLKETKRFSEDPLKGAPTDRQFSCYSKAESDLNGEAGCIALEKQFKNLYAIDLCRKTGGYLPPVGELEKAFLNLEAINLSRAYLGLELIPFGWYWTSSLKDEFTIWCCYSNGCTWRHYTWEDWDRSDGYVVSFSQI